MAGRIDRGEPRRFDDTTRLHHLEEIARNMNRVAHSTTATQQVRSAAAHNHTTVRWALDKLRPLITGDRTR